MSDASRAQARDQYLCRFVSETGDKTVVAAVVARDASIAMARFVTLHAARFCTGSIEILDAGGQPLLTQAWMTGPR